VQTCLPIIYPNSSSLPPSSLSFSLLTRATQPRRRRVPLCSFALQQPSTYIYIYILWRSVLGKKWIRVKARIGRGTVGGRGGGRGGGTKKVHRMAECITYRWQRHRDTRDDINPLSRLVHIPTPMRRYYAHTGTLTSRRREAIKNLRRSKSPSPPLSCMTPAQVGKASVCHFDLQCWRGAQVLSKRGEVGRRGGSERANREKGRSRSASFIVYVSRASRAD